MYFNAFEFYSSPTSNKMGFMMMFFASINQFFFFFTFSLFINLSELFINCRSLPYREDAAPRDQVGKCGSVKFSLVKERWFSKRPSERPSSAFMLSTFVLRTAKLCFFFNSPNNFPSSFCCTFCAIYGNKPDQIFKMRRTHNSPRKVIQM